MRFLQQLLCRKDKQHEDEDPPDKKTDQGDLILTAPEADGPLDLGHLLLHLTRRLKVKQAAILDQHGLPLHVTSDFFIQADDGPSLLRIMRTAPVAGMFRFHIFGDDFRCFHCDGSASTVLGYSASTILTAHLTRKHVVVGLAPEQVPGSCLHEMMQVWSQMEARGL